MKRKLALMAAAVAVVGMVASNAFAQTDDNNRAGWGKGDKNHVHTGPPGRSTNPGHHNLFWWWIWNFLSHFFHIPWDWK